MVFRTVRWALALGVALGWSASVAEAQPSFSLSPGWDQVFELSTGEVVQQSGDTLWFDTPIAFKGTWDTTGVGVGLPYNVYNTPDHRVDFGDSVPGGTQGSRYAFVPALMDDSVTLNVDVWHPYQPYIVAFDSLTQGVSQAQFVFSDCLSGCPISPSMVQGWCKSLGNDLVNRCFAPLYDQNSIDSLVMSTGLPESEVRNRIGAAQSNLRTVGTGLERLGCSGVWYAGDVCLTDWNG